ncbi:S8 family peptidase [Streptomyces sp. NPDC057287]|uniref:S8 family peptidase n=1 Tax=Streptomyces sp. NPDC057287 TaxID=3346086 RepID=UPI00362D09B1
MPVITQEDDPWGLARISHREKLTFATLKKYAYDDRTGEPVMVYVLDTGIETDHEEFDNRASWGFSCDQGEWDDNGRGTHLAATVAGRTYGAAKNAYVSAVKVAWSNGAASPDDVIKGLKWAMKDARGHEARSVVLFGMALPSHPELDELAAAAVNQGLFLVAPAGDDSKDAAGYSPAGAEGVFTVAASELDDDRADFSNVGPSIDVFAPGHSIMSAYRGGPKAATVISGTAQAAAHVAGLAAYLLSTSADVNAGTVGKTITTLASKDRLAKVPQGTRNLLANNNAGT